MAEISEITVGRLEGKIDSMNFALKEINQSLHGNGQAGLEERITRNEERFIQIVKNVEIMCNDSEKLSNSIKELTSAVEDLKDLVKDHTEDSKVHSIQGLVFRRDVIPIAVLVFVLLHSLLPSDISLWELIKKILGF